MRDRVRFLSDVSLSSMIGIKIRVISAMMVRDIVGKYGRGNIGFLWMIIEPSFLMLGVITVWASLHGDDNHGLPIVAFILTSYVQLTIYRHLSNMSRMMSGNYGLLYHRQISVFDIFFAKMLSEVAAVSAAGMIVYFGLLSLGYVEWVYDPCEVLLGYGLMIWFSFSLGLLTAGLSEKSDVIENLIQPVQYLMLPVSGAFFMISWLPHAAQPYALLLPMPHTYEIFRYGFFGNKMEPHYSIAYVVIWSTVLTALGVWSIASSRKTLTFR